MLTLLARRAQIKARIFRPNTVVLFTLSAQALRTYRPLRRGAYAPHSTTVASPRRRMAQPTRSWRFATTHLTPVTSRDVDPERGQRAPPRVVLDWWKDAWWANSLVSTRHMAHLLGLRGGSPLMRPSAMSNIQRWRQTMPTSRSCHTLRPQSLPLAAARGR